MGAKDLAFRTGLGILKNPIKIQAGSLHFAPKALNLRP
jgi:hypothetical protein